MRPEDIGENRRGGFEIARAGGDAGAESERRAGPEIWAAGGGFGFDPAGAGDRGQIALTTEGRVGPSARPHTSLGQRPR